ncbi:molybdenum cofactor biosynthesis protein MoaE [Cellulomonas sp. P24]|uniref:molybdenum cofactor biosynthesis protein MoaE n=1 Tax=Cellulomonas sp. P24 TaxID=2885206 RepID=UPI00216AEB07|nr:molybdenum cofactor biosynthesis protein MoaE [Cellulomonas sp. P24]MCR6491079.1 molybdenum cofactor biosynthesis protein MoaE [Cellulomonas sp. P24]
MRTPAPGDSVPEVTGHLPARAVVRAQVTTEPIDPAGHATEVERPEAGAVVTFAGVVRDHDDGRSVNRIAYVAHPDAADILRRIAEDVAARTEVESLAVSHRVGELAVGDCALAVAVSAAHRGQAFAAAALLVDEVKRLLPVWKRQVFTDGTDEWVGCA